MIRGLTFDVSSTSKVMGGGIVHVWGPSGANSSVLDCVFRGNAAIPYGIVALNPSGLKVERSEFFNFTDVGLRLTNNETVGFGGSTPTIEAVRDIYVDTVTPGDAGCVQRHRRGGAASSATRSAKPSSGSRSGTSPGQACSSSNNAWRTSYRNLDINMNGPEASRSVGVYLEHYSYENTFEQFSIVARTGSTRSGPTRHGAVGPPRRTRPSATASSTPARVGGTKNQAGVYLDEGTETTTVTGVTFRNQNWAGIGAYKNVGTNTFGG